MISLNIETKEELDELQSVIADTNNHIDNISIYNITRNKVIFTNTKPIKLLQGYHIHNFADCICHINNEHCCYNPERFSSCSGYNNGPKYYELEIDNDNLRIEYPFFTLSDHISIDKYEMLCPTFQSNLNLKIDFPRTINKFAFDSIYIE